MGPHNRFELHRGTLPLDYRHHNYKPGKGRWFLIAVGVLVVLIFVWWASTPTAAERAALDAAATAVAVVTVGP